MPALDWRAVARSVLLARELDQLEERELVPGKMQDARRMVKYQFSSGGHELVQVLLAQFLDHPHDAAVPYYRSRPFMLAVGLTPREALAAGQARSGAPSDGRDVGVVFNLPKRGRATVLPGAGDVGAQFSPAAGWATAIRYYSRVLNQPEWQGAIAVAMGGDASVASNGFWAALNVATTQNLPLLFWIEDNGYGISVPSQLQTPGGDIAANLEAYSNLRLFDCDGTDPLEAADTIATAVAYVRERGTALARLRVPRLQGHTYGEDPRAYKSADQIAAEHARDPLLHLREHLFKQGLRAQDWNELFNRVRAELDTARRQAEELPEPDPATATDHIFFQGVPAQMGEASCEPSRRAPAPLPVSSTSPTREPESMHAHESLRINMLDAIRRTLEHELAVNSRMLLFGEDVGPRGGVHRATVGLQKEFGPDRVFDTSLNEAGIMGRAQGLAIAGLLPVPEIQFRKYADPAQNELDNIGTLRWRTANRFAAPLVVRMPLGYAQKAFGPLGDPWHSPTAEAIYAHMLGWRIAFPSNAHDAVGLLRAALRGHDPTMFLEHRALLDTPHGRRPYPGDDFLLPFGQAATVRAGDELTVITWGECVYRALDAADAFPDRIEVIDLRTLSPWDKAAVLTSVRKTGKVMVVHEDTLTAGFGGEIVATLAREAFTDLDAPVARVAAADVPPPFNANLLGAVLPSVPRIRATMQELLSF